MTGLPPCSDRENRGGGGGDSGHGRPQKAAHPAVASLVEHGCHSSLLPAFRFIGRDGLLPGPPQPIRSVMMRGPVTRRSLHKPPGVWTVTSATGDHGVAPSWYVMPRIFTRYVEP